MKEFGSDFHLFTDVSIRQKFLLAEKNDLLFYATGRYAIQALIMHRCWKRIWMPEYFCYDIIESVRATGITVVFYPDHPTADDNALIEGIAFEPHDVLFRMNYFGLRSRRNNAKLTVEIIEDHSHNLLSEWAMRSDADYCIASLRKTLPLTEGGILWSPKGHSLPDMPTPNAINEQLAIERFAAMSLKRLYVQGDMTLDKEMFRSLYIKTEKQFEKLSACSLSDIDRMLLDNLDVTDFYARKKQNWLRLVDILKGKVTILTPEDDAEVPFSLVIQCKSESVLNHYRQQLIEQKVYPAQLWPIPAEHRTVEYSFLSIHCDGRYSLEDMDELGRRMESLT